MLKSYYVEILAVKITLKNYNELKLLDDGDGCLRLITKEEAIGEWFVFRHGGYEVMPSDTKLVKIKE